MSQTTLLASAPTMERLEGCIRRYFGGPRVLILHPGGRIENGNGILSGLQWRVFRGRYRFERVTDCSR